MNPCPRCVSGAAAHLPGCGKLLHVRKAVASASGPARFGADDPAAAIRRIAAGPFSFLLRRAQGPAARARRGCGEVCRGGARRDACQGCAVEHSSLRVHVGRGRTGSRRRAELGPSWEVMGKKEVERMPLEISDAGAASFSENRDGSRVVLSLSAFEGVVQVCYSARSKKRGLLYATHSL